MRAREFVSESWHWRNKNRVYDLLANAIDSGPFDGGCVVFAQALQKLYGGEIVVLTGTSTDGSAEQAQHAALLLNGDIIDADGPANPRAFAQRFQENELDHTGGKVTGYRPLRDGDLPDAPRDEQLATEIVKLLTSKGPAIA